MPLLLTSFNKAEGIKNTFKTIWSEFLHLITLWSPLKHFKTTFAQDDN